MTDGRCATCRHWEPPDPSRDNRPPGVGFGRCGLASLEDGDTLQHWDTLAFAEDAESYMAWLHTSPEFGCVQWAGRDGS